MATAIKRYSDGSHPEGSPLSPQVIQNHAPWGTRLLGLGCRMRRARYIHGQTHWVEGWLDGWLDGMNGTIVQFESQLAKEDGAFCGATYVEGPGRQCAQ